MDETKVPTRCSIPECNADDSGEPCDRHETEQAHAEGEHQWCGVTCEAKFPSDQMRNFVVAKGYPGTAGMLAELERRAAQQPTPAAIDEAALWQNLADALNALADYGLDPLAGTVSPALVDAGDVIHGGGVRVGGQRLCWLGAGGNDDHEYGSKWIVEDRDGFKTSAGGAK